MNTVTIPPHPDMPTLFDAQAQRPLTIREQFAVFHTENPRVFEALEAMAAEMVLRGRKRISARMLIEALRYDFYIKTDDPNSDFKVNNNYSAHYARMLLDVHPDWEGLFQLREIHEGSAFLVRRKAS